MKLTTGIVALVFAGNVTANAAAATPAGGLAFDQIQYTLGANQARPSAPNFAADYRLAMESATNANAPRAASASASSAQTVEMAGNLASSLAGGAGNNLSALTGLGAHIGAGLFARHAESQARNAALDASSRAGTLVRFAFNAQGWERIETPQNHQVVIFKPESQQEIILDTEARTWHEQSVDATAAANGGPILGTATSTYAETSAAIPALTVDGRRTTGAQSTIDITATGAKGACKNGRAEIVETSYVTNVAIPAALARYEALHELGVQPGCVPTVSGPLPTVDHLAVFRIVDINGGSKTTPSTIVTERGNVRQLGPQDAGLFEVPADYTRT